MSVKAVSGFAQKLGNVCGNYHINLHFANSAVGESQNADANLTAPGYTDGQRSRMSIPNLSFYISQGSTKLQNIINNTVQHELTHALTLNKTDYTDITSGAGTIMQKAVSSDLNAATKGRMGYGATVWKHWVTQALNGLKP